MSNNLSGFITGTVNTSDTAYIQKVLQEQIQIINTPITYSSRTQTGNDNYGHPNFTYTVSTIKAAISLINDTDYPLILAGFNPLNDVKVWVYQVIPAIGDRFTDLANITYEIRGVWPRQIGGQVIFYELVARRVITQESISG